MTVKKVALTGFFLLMAVSVAMAVDDVIIKDAPAVAPFTWAYPIWEVVSPVLLTIAAPIGAALALLISGQLAKLLNIKDASAQKDLEAKVRDALHQAALNGLKYAIAKRVGPVGDLVAGAIPVDILDDAFKYVHSKNPDVAAAIPDADLIQIIMSKAIEVQSQIEAAKPAVVVTP